MNVSAQSWRPLKAGEILDRAFRLYRANFWIFLNTVVIFFLPLLVIEFVIEYFFRNAIFLIVFEQFLIANILNGAMVWLVSQAYLEEYPLSILKAYWYALGHFGPVLLVNLYLALIYLVGTIGVLVAVTSIGYILLMSLMAMSFTRIIYGSQIFDVFAFLLLSAAFFLYFFGPVANYVFWTVRWGLAIPAVLIERISVRKVLDRSWNLTAKDFWHSSIVVGASALLFFLITLIPSILGSYVMLFFPDVSTLGLIPFLVLLHLGYVISIPLTISIIVILYYELRVRREGYDLELSIQSAIENDALGEEIEG